MFDLKTGKSKEFGFVCFESHLSAAYAKDKLNGKWISKKNRHRLSVLQEAPACCNQMSRKFMGGGQIAMCRSLSWCSEEF